MADTEPFTKKQIVKVYKWVNDNQYTLTDQEIEVDVDTWSQKDFYKSYLKDVKEYALVPITIQVWDCIGKWIIFGKGKPSHRYNEDPQERNYFVKLMKKTDVGLIVKLPKHELVNYGYGPSLLSLYVFLAFDQDSTKGTEHPYYIEPCPDDFEAKILSGAHNYTKIPAPFKWHTYTPPSEKECAVCMESKPDCYFDCPFLHHICCSACAKKMNKCPICNVKSNVIPENKIVSID